MAEPDDTDHRPLPLAMMKRALARSEVEHGPDALSTRMLRAEIERWEYAKKHGSQTHAEHFTSGPASSIGRRR